MSEATSPKFTPKLMPPNALYYADNLDILRRYIADESFDLIYLDPPFYSAADFAVLFAQNGGTWVQAQIKAFEFSGVSEGPLINSETTSNQRHMRMM